MGSNPIFSAIFIYHRGIAQLVEQWSPKPRAEGSSPSAPAKNKSLAIVEFSTCKAFIYLLLHCSFCENYFSKLSFFLILMGYYMGYCLLAKILAAVKTSSELKLV